LAAEAWNNEVTYSESANKIQNQRIISLLLSLSLFTHPRIASVLSPRILQWQLRFS